MTRTALAFVTAAALTGVAAELGSAQQAGPPGGRPSLEGTWNSATATPLERPRELADKPFFTPEEAAAWEQSFLERNEEPPTGTASTQRGTGTFNTVYREFGTQVVKTLRTSIVTDPADGRIPPLTPEAAARRRVRLEQQRTLEHPEGASLQDRCVMFSTSGPPLLPYSYNSNYQIVQTDDAVLVHAEMIHDARVIHLDGRAPPPAHVRFLSGYSVGRWDADTLVVETTNFTDAGGFYGSAGGQFAWSENLRVVERFSLYDQETLLYRFEMYDLSAFTRPWSGELTMTRTSDLIYEYACHEGNYALEGMLRGARATERAAEGSAGR